MNLYESFKKKLKESAYSDINPDEISKDAYLKIKRNDDGSVRVDTGIGDHTNLGSGNYTKIPNGEVSRLYDEVINKAKARKGSLKFKDNFGRDKATELDKVIDAYNNDLDKDVKDLEPYADRPLKRRELDEITEITGRRDASGHSERQMKHRNDGSYGRLQGAINKLKQTSKDLDDESYTKLTLEADKKKLNEAFPLQTDDEIEQEIEKYKASQLDAISKRKAKEENDYQEYMKRREEDLNDYIKSRDERLETFHKNNEPTEERLNAKREELRKKREEDKVQYEKWFEDAKKSKERYFSDVESLEDLADKENPGDFKHGGFNVCFSYNGKSYWVAWYDSDVYLPSDHRDGYNQWEFAYEIPNSDVHKWKSEIKPIRDMKPEDFGLEVKPGTRNRVKGIIDLSKLK